MTATRNESLSQKPSTSSPWPQRGIHSCLKCVIFYCFVMLAARNPFLAAVLFRHDRGDESILSEMFPTALPLPLRGIHSCIKCMQLLHHNRSEYSIPVSNVLPRQDRSVEKIRVSNVFYRVAMTATRNPFQTKLYSTAYSWPQRDWSTSVSGIQATASNFPENFPNCCCFSNLSLCPTFAACSLLPC